jgi:peptidoglycan DL-endopeptidase CwlO
MSVGSISFWQQDQNFWAQAQQNDQSQTASSTLITGMFNATTTQSTGLSSLANQTALNRVNNALSAAVQNALQGITGSASTSSSSSSSTNAAASSSNSSTSGSSSSPTPPSSPATGTGTAPLLTSTTLLTLGILAKGTISVSDGTNTTTYKSTGTDTVGDLINAINANVTGRANVAAGLNANGQLVLTSQNDTDPVVVGGTYASNIGFGPANDTFQPTTPAASSTNSSSGGASSSSSSSTGASSSRTSGSSNGSSTTTTSGGSAASGIPKNSALALQSGGTAELLLASNGLSGNILDMLA